MTKTNPLPSPMLCQSYQTAPPAVQPRARGFDETLGRGLAVRHRDSRTCGKRRFRQAEMYGRRDDNADTALQVFRHLLFATGKQPVAPAGGHAVGNLGAGRGASPAAP